MTKYAGEVLQVRSAIQKLNRSGPFTDVDGLATITIFDIDGVTPLVDDEPMTWDPDDVDETDSSADPGAWLYDWTSVDVPGAYAVRVKATGSDSSESWEYKVIRTRKNPYPKTA